MSHEPTVPIALPQACEIADLLDRFADCDESAPAQRANARLIAAGLRRRCDDVAAKEHELTALRRQTIRALPGEPAPAWMSEALTT